MCAVRLSQAGGVFRPKVSKSIMMRDVTSSLVRPAAVALILEAVFCCAISAAPRKRPPGAFEPYMT